MKLAINILLSLTVLTVCVWLVWPSAEQQLHIREAAAALHFEQFAPYLAGHLALVAVTHFCRAWRWNHLLHPLGVRLSPTRLLAISSVGFMAILALPARLGEFVRPALVRKKGEISASAALGTIAVERIIDGLLVSLFVFGALFALRGPKAPDWMMPTAYTALSIFAAALMFLATALRWPKKTIHFWVTMSAIRFVSEKFARKLEEKLLEMISGFLVLKDRRNLVYFVLWSLVYWGVNGLSLWVLARGLGLDLGLLAAFATMGLVAVGITLPNSPGLVGQYQFFALLGLGLYLDLDDPDVKAKAFVFAIALHGIQVLWYLTMGAIAITSKHVSFAEVVAATPLRNNTGDAPSTTNA